MFENVTTEYIQFIKQTIILKSYEKVIKIAYEKNIDASSLFQHEPSNEIISIWNTAFNSIHELVRYYGQLHKHYYDSIYDDDSDGNEIEIYKYNTFQEAIDKVINIQTIGAYDYQQFIKNMRDEKFCKNYKEKYRQDNFEKHLRNRIIFDIYTLFTHEYNLPLSYGMPVNLELHINIEPYLEYRANYKPQKNEYLQRIEENAFAHLTPVP
jgi:hypothetical protein